MRILKGKEIQNINREDLKEIIKDYSQVIMDLGTGDGRFVYKNAHRNEENFYIGIDPSHSQLETYSKKSQKNDVHNCMFVIASLEQLPEELYGLAANLYINLPWGTLLQSIVSPTKELIQGIYDLLEVGGELRIIFGYSQDAEPSEITRLGLKKLNIDYIKKKVIPAFMELGFTDATVSEKNKEELKDIESTWGKRLAFGNDRPLYQLKFKKSELGATSSLKSGDDSATITS